MSQTLYLLRHAKAEPWYPGVNDFTRPLSVRGRDHMDALVAKFGTEIDLPEHILCSGSSRTRQTLAPLIEAHPELAGVTVYTDEIYEGTAGALHALAESAFAQCESLMMVGHNPGFEQLALGLMRPQDRLGIHKMPTGTLAVIEFSDGYEAGAGQGVLRHWLRRKDL